MGGGGIIERTKLGTEKLVVNSTNLISLGVKRQFEEIL
jgi:hypothetical protein